MVNTKKCSKCGQIKLVSFFYLDRTSKTGYGSECKECSKRGKRQRKLSLKHREVSVAAVHLDQVFRMWVRLNGSETYEI